MGPKKPVNEPVVCGPWMIAEYVFDPKYELRWLYLPDLSWFVVTVFCLDKPVFVDALGELVRETCLICSI